MEDILVTDWKYAPGDPSNLYTDERHTTKIGPVTIVYSNGFIQKSGHQVQTYTVRHPDDRTEVVPATHLFIEIGEFQERKRRASGQPPKPRGWGANSR